MSTVAAQSFAQTLPLLHYEGILVAQDLFAGNVSQYASYRGPGKLEGSIVNWINAPIFQLIGERSGFEVTVDQLEFPAAWLEDVFTAGDYEMSIIAHVEPRDMRAVFGNPDYYTKYGTSQIQALFAEADAGTEEEQVAALKEAAALIS